LRPKYFKAEEDYINEIMRINPYIPQAGDGIKKELAFFKEKLMERIVNKEKILRDCFLRIRENSM